MDATGKDEGSQLTVASYLKFSRIAHCHITIENFIVPYRYSRDCAMKNKFDRFSRGQSLEAPTVPDAQRFGHSFKIIFKMIWKHSLVFLICYFSLTVLYNFGLDEEQVRNFEALTSYLARYTRTFNWMIMLGFFTNTALQRLFTTQMTIPGTDRITTLFTMSLKPNLPEGPAIVDLYARWTVLAWILTFRIICHPLRREFPNLQAIQDSGILLEEEKRILLDEDNPVTVTPRPLVVIEWMLLLLKESMKEDRYIKESSHIKNVEAVMAFKKSCGNTIKNIPYAVIQAVVLVVYWFCTVLTMARNLRAFKNEFVRNIISYFPVMPYIQFFVFIAWLSFGRAAVNPFGNDESDINVMQLCEAHIKHSFRLKNLYTNNLDEDVFRFLPHKNTMPSNSIQTYDNKSTAILVESDMDI
uniref:Bestrophin homolog n=1 Tax=Daphnia galeata TaxID=27404 RepID=A0A8J2RSJ8_9CRUS|nr:unnamed protein product [Daphnia galeata]